MMFRSTGMSTKCPVSTYMIIGHRMTSTGCSYFILNTKIIVHKNENKHKQPRFTTSTKVKMLLKAWWL